MDRNPDWKFWPPKVQGRPDMSVDISKEDLRFSGDDEPEQRIKGKAGRCGYGGTSYLNPRGNF
jgi:hypothetical protein